MKTWLADLADLESVLPKIRDYPTLLIWGTGIAPFLSPPPNRFAKISATPASWPSKAWDIFLTKNVRNNSIAL